MTNYLFSTEFNPNKLQEKYTDLFIGVEFSGTGERDETQRTENKIKTLK